MKIRTEYKSSPYWPLINLFFTTTLVYSYDVIGTKCTADSLDWNRRANFLAVKLSGENTFGKGLAY